MKPLSVPRLAVYAAVALILGGLVQALLIRTARTPLLMTPWLALLFVLVAIWLLVLGLGIRKLKKRENTWVTPVMAGRGALFARSSAPITALCAGFLIGVALVAFTRSWAPVMEGAAWSALAGGVAAAIACAVAVMVERWAIDTSSDEDDKDGRGPTRGRPSPHQARQSSL